MAKKKTFLIVSLFYGTVIAAATPALLLNQIQVIGTHTVIICAQLISCLRMQHL